MDQEEIKETFRERCPDCGSEEVSKCESKYDGNISSIIRHIYKCQKCRNYFVLLEIT